MTTQTYPVILTPTPGATVQFPTKAKGGKTKKHGPSELIAFSRIHRMGFKEIRCDVCVTIGGHHYEPDMALIDREHGICIDIEVDEPYSAQGHPTHFLEPDGSNKDSARNQKFQDAGWYVVRFPEEMLYCHPKECVKELYKLLQNIGAIAELPQNLQSVADLQPMQRWTKNDSYRMAERNYRKSYLGFDPAHLGFSGAMKCCKLVTPILGQSFTDSQVRKELGSQLKNFFHL